MAPKRKSRRSGKTSRKKWWKWLLLLLLLVGLAGVYVLFGPNTGALTEGEYVYIRTGSRYDDVKKALKDGGFVRDLRTFDLLARQAGYPDRVRAGKYHISRGMSNYNIVRLLRSGRQTPVKLVVGKLRTKNDFIRLLSRNLEADSNVLRQMFADTVYLAQFGLDTNTVLCGVMPDTYEFYWNTSADKAFRKIEKKFAAFWNEDRRLRASKLSLRPDEVITLASIIEEESNKNDEKPNIASVYLNRLRNGTRLQADPTARWAYGDFTIKRITSTQTSIQSPYNTYQVTGLPPGPICTPSPQSIDAVLNAPKTDYLYFCAREDFSGYHRFAATYDEHLKNARLYQQALNARNIH